MKKLICALIFIAIAACSVAFTGRSEFTPYGVIGYSDRFVVLKERTTGNTIYIEMYDKYTKVMYVYIKLASSGNLVPLLDTDGTPLLYDIEE